jgi:hypothetical protein
MMFRFLSKLLLGLTMLMIALKPSNARLTPGHRHLEKDCEDYKGLYSRCCKENTAACSCPVREYEGFGGSIIQYLWDVTCQRLEDKVVDCDIVEGNVTITPAGVP